MTGYYIERSTNQSDRWFRITKEALTRPQLNQSELIEGTTYQYRAVSINKKGDSQPSEASEPFTCKPQFSKFTVIIHYLIAQCDQSKLDTNLYVL